MLTTIALLAVSAVAPSPADPETRPSPPGAGGVAWFRGSLAEALLKAERERKLVFLEFRIRWCDWCDQLEREALADERVLAELEGAVSLCVDAQKGEGVELAERFGVDSYPTLLVLSSSGKAEDRLGGYVRPLELLVGLRRVKRDEETVSFWERAVHGAPEDLTARFELAEKLLSVGDRAGHDREVARIKESDPQGRSLPMRMFALRSLGDATRASLKKDGVLDASRLVAFLADESYPRVLFNGWSTLAACQVDAGDHAGARASFKNAWRACPERRVPRSGNLIAWSFWLMRDELDDAERAFALDVARKAAAASGEDAWVLDTLACCLFMNGREDEAAKTIRRVIELEPGNEQWRERLRMFLGEDG